MKHQDRGIEPSHPDFHEIDKQDKDFKFWREYFAIMYGPADVFSIEQLEEWALSNNFIKKDKE